MKKSSRIARIALIGAIISALLVILPGPLFRMGVDFGTLFQILTVGTIAAFVFAILALVALILAFARGRPKLVPALAVLIAGGAAIFMGSLMNQGRSVPPIHDITTDMDSPPAFVAVAPLRADAPNPVDYDPAIAAQQREAYPDIQPLTVDAPAGDVFERALAAVEDRGWTLVEANPQEGRIEATATTGWFGFQDDVVIRIQPSGIGTRVDVRSKSRMGQSDLGANAARIRAFIQDLESA